MYVGWSCVTDAPSKIEQERPTVSDLLTAYPGRHDRGRKDLLVGELDSPFERGSDAVSALSGAELTGTKAQLVALDWVRSARQLLVKVPPLPPSSTAEA